MSPRDERAAEPADADRQPHPGEAQPPDPGPGRTAGEKLVVFVKVGAVGLVASLVCGLLSTLVVERIFGAGALGLFWRCLLGAAPASAWQGSFVPAMAAHAGLSTAAVWACLELTFPDRKDEDVEQDKLIMVIGHAIGACLVPLCGIPPSVNIP